MTEAINRQVNFKNYAAERQLPYIIMMVLVSATRATYHRYVRIQVRTWHSP
jgi:hypothetical protein